MHTFLFPFSALVLQMVYKLNGFLLRDASQQQGEALSFIEEK
jgi:hypothetical protein